MIGFPSTDAEGQTDIWKKLAKFEGTITAVHLTSSFYYASTDGAGVFRSDDGQNWSAINIGLHELNIQDITSNPVNASQLFCISNFFIYYSTNNGDSWAVYYPQIPQMNGIGLDYHPQLTCIGVLSCSSSGSMEQIYVGTYGESLWRRVNGPSTQWEKYSAPPIIHDFVNFGDKLYAGVEYQSGVTSGLWSGDCKDGSSLSPVLSFPATSCHALAVRPYPTTPARPFVLAGTVGMGIYANTVSAGDFSPLCGISPASLPDTGTFHALDFCYDAGVFYGFAGTGTQLWCLQDDPRTCSSSDDGYTSTDHWGHYSAIRLKHSGFALVGTKGKGQFLGIPAICQLDANSEGQIVHRQINRVVVSPNFATEQVIFTASRSEGIYKSIDGGQRFTRFFCDPAGYGPLDILSLAMSPYYHEWLPVHWNGGVYYDAKTLLAGSNGRGVFRSRDGGASWDSSNGGTLSATSVVTDIVFSPNAQTDTTAYAAAWSDGMYVSTDMGGVWTKVDCTSMYPNIHDIEVHPDYSTDPWIWMATEAGIIKVEMDKLDCSTYWSINEANRIKVRMQDPNIYMCWGTPDKGVWRRAYAGVWREWQMVDTQIGATAKVIDIDVSPNIYNDGNYYVIVMALVYDSASNKIKLYQTKDYLAYSAAPGSIWVPVISASDPPTTNWNYETVHIQPGFDPGTTHKRFYLGHSFEGLFYADYIPAGNIPSPNWSDAKGYYALPHEVTDTEVDPADPNIILYATKDLGMFISYDGGETACPWNRNLYYKHATLDRWYNTTYISSIAISDEDISHVFFSEDFSDGLDSSIWTVQSYSANCFDPECRWMHSQDPLSPCTNRIYLPLIDADHAIIDSDCAGTGLNQSTEMYTGIDFYGATQVNLAFNHYFRWWSGELDERGYVEVRSANTGGAWQTLATYQGASFGPIRTTFDITPLVTGLPVDDNLAYITWFYTNARYEMYWQVDSIEVSGTKGRNVVIGTKKTPGFTTAGHGLYYMSYNSRPEARDGMWNWSASTDAGAIRYAEVSQVIDYGPGVDMWASIDIGPVPAYRSSDFGQTWVPEAGGITDALFTDIDYSEALIKGLVGSAWACSSGRLGKTGKSTDPTGAYYFDTTDWTLQNGSGPYALPETIEYEAIIENSSGIVFIGGWTVGQTADSGIWCYDTASPTPEWFQVNQGLPAHINGKMISSFLEIENGKMLVGIRDEVYGGVFMSDSGGFAWQRVDDFAEGSRGVNALTMNERVVATITEYQYYASMVNDGSRQRLEGDDGMVSMEYPVPEFLVNNQLRTLADKRYPADNTTWVSVTMYDAVTFNNKTAGAADVTAWSWDFGDTYCPPSDNASMLTNPTHRFSQPGEYTVTLTVMPGSASVSHKIRVDVPTPASFPFSDDFEAKSMDGHWKAWTTNIGRVRVSTAYPYEGSNSVLLDNAISGGTKSIAALILPIDLTGATDVQLDFWWREFADENDPEDGVFISDDHGASWTLVKSFNNGLATWTHEFLDLDELVALNGLSFNDSFQIKFQFYDDYPIPSDGYAIDLVRVTIPPPPIPARDSAKAKQAMRAAKKDALGNVVTISYDASDCMPSTVNVLYGSLGSISTYALGTCSGGTEPTGCCGLLPLNPTSGSPAEWTTNSATNIWFLLVNAENDGGTLRESSWGKDSAGNERNGSVVSGTCGCTSKEPTGNCY